MKHAFIASEIWVNNQRQSNTVLIVENGTIEALLPKTEFEKLNPIDYTITDFKDGIIFPGFVNTHTHSFQSLLKGVADDTDFFTWRENALYKYSKAITPEDLYTGALFAFSEMLLNGITTVCDFFYIHAKSNSNAKAILKAAEDLGIRFTLARTFYDWDGAPDNYRETPEQATTNTEALINEINSRNTNGMQQIITAPHSLHGASQEMILAASDLAKKHNLPYHMHIAEGEYERKMMLDKTGKSPMQLLADWGVMTENLTGIHCVWVDETDINIMAQQNMKVSYNPNSNMFLGDGITPIKTFLEKKITVGLGTDGGCSNNRASIVDEMRACALLQKVSHLDGTAISAEQVIQMGTTNGEKVLKQKIGQLAVGYFADFIVLKRNDLSLQPDIYWPKQLVYSMQPQAIEAVYINGQKTMQSGQILTIEKEKTVRNIQELWQRWQNT